MRPALRLPKVHGADVELGNFVLRADGPTGGGYAASRALLLPRRRPDRRQPLWQQRHRSAQLLGVAADHPDFPILLEAARECLQDDFDVAALADLMRDLAGGLVRMVQVATTSPSPFAQSLLFGYTAQFLYDGDAPLAERRGCGGRACRDLSDRLAKVRWDTDG